MGIREVFLWSVLSTLQLTKLHCLFVMFEVFMAVTMKNPVFWDIQTQFVPHRRLIASPLQSSAG
jgi:hypothetical protein